MCNVEFVTIIGSLKYFFGFWRAFHKQKMILKRITKKETLNFFGQHLQQHYRGGTTLVPRQMQKYSGHFLFEQFRKKSGNY